ncbi:tetratricopeptide repeat protein [uncultured Cocleimonas sp.]|uniref:YfgM family protein n=1 Tax=uncultured Cocleimonas sp. TaxID=1051587 RepID=UPI0026354F4E|nr:tetratricopeptide repeat protein [uncultured Cocleimonas sp.]
MADYDLKSDEEKAEELKAWWRSNGTSVIAGVALTVGGMFGWNYWKEHKVTQSEGASKLYSQLDQVGADSTDVLKKLEDEYGSTSYAYLAALSSAKTSCEAGKTEECIAELKKATESPQDSLANLAKLRLARTLVSTGKLDEAKSILSGKMPVSYQSLISELNGDIHFAKKEFKQAYEAYDKAILSAGDQNTQLLKMKRDDLGNQLKSGA